MSLWNIVVPGLAENIAEHLTDEGKVICVNAALNHVPRCDWWVCYDAPNDVHTSSIPACRRLRPRILTEQNRHKPWREATLAWPLDEQPSVVVCKWEPAWLAAAIKVGPRYSTFMAVLWAVQGGATEIRVHGSTMMGKGYCDEKANLSMSVRQRSNNFWASRWEKERAMMKRAKAACEERGIAFEVLVPSSVKHQKIKDQREK